MKTCQNMEIETYKHTVALSKNRTWDLSVTIVQSAQQVLDEKF